DELFDSTPVVESATAEFYGNPAWANLPRKHKYSIASCADRCNAPEINCVSLVGVLNEGRKGYAVEVGAGLASVPRIARDLGVHAQKQPEFSYIGVPVQLGLASGDQLIAVADLTESFGGDIRLTRQQNLIVTGVPNVRVDEVLAGLAALGLPLETSEIWANSI